MFPSRYFPDRYFPPRYFSRRGSNVAPVVKVLYLYPGPIISTLGFDHTVGDLTVTLEKYTGSLIQRNITRFGLASISTTRPFLFMLSRNISKSMTGPNSHYCLFKATGLSGDTLTGVSVMPGYQDQPFVAGDNFATYWTAESYEQIVQALLP